MPAKKAATKKAAAKPATAEPRGGSNFRYVGPFPQVFPDLAQELEPGDTFVSNLELHHVWLEEEVGGEWQSTYEGEDVQILDPEPEEA